MAKKTWLTEEELEEVSFKHWRIMGMVEELSETFLDSDIEFFADDFDEIYGKLEDLWSRISDYRPMTEDEREDGYKAALADDERKERLLAR